MTYCWESQTKLLRIIDKNKQIEATLSRSVILVKTVRLNTFFLDFFCHFFAVLTLLLFAISTPDD